ncbi:hypothetical protein U6A24_12070 [Aquimarina gracilis]|uniref:PepSY domain-containing protein n=1 Tax=Aquimarina gracilis TaxID=874422 RepID=A0ABU5ZWF1_9FLAO|nr:hypothetical protein [Aquimarina gracilis]MEB3346204.1 hypothetical protein [Aquimarina gracilis]
MKNYILPLLLFSTFLLFSSFSSENFSTIPLDKVQNQSDRKLSPEEVKQRGIDLLVNEIVEQIDEIDLRKMARSAIFETSYGFRWKMVNLHTGKKIIIKVDKDFKLISARTGDNIKIMIPGSC